jgi:cytochrome c oxidase assembly factor 3, fungi type
MSPGLRRAREPFLVKNAITGIGLFAFAVGVYTYSIKAVQQEQFEDIDEQAKEIQAVRAISRDDQQKAMDAAVAANVARTAEGVDGPMASTSLPIPAPPPPAASSSAGLTPGMRRGLLARWLGDRYPSTVDSSGNVLVWGAPNVDKPGTLGDKSRRI